MLLKKHSIRNSHLLGQRLLRKRAQNRQQLFPHSNTMDPAFQPIATFFAIGSLGMIAGGLGIFALILLRILLPKNKHINIIENFLLQNSLYLAFFIALSGTFGSLFLSEIAALPPCELCWYQRIFVYSQTFIFLPAIYYKDAKVFLYSLFLSTIGLVIALWHIFVQYQPTLGSCSDSVVSCSKIQLEIFGFVTIPFMSACLFFILIALSILNLTRTNKSKK